MLPIHGAHCEKPIPFAMQAGTFTLECRGCKGLTEVVVASEDGTPWLTTTAGEPIQEYRR